MLLLRKAARRGLGKDAAEFDSFCRDNASWLSDYALYMALKEHFGGASWTEWPEDIRLHRAEAVEKYRAELASDVRFYSYVQYLFYRQWNALREYARKNGVGMIGDMPIYVALDSADVWSSRSFSCSTRKTFPLRSPEFRRTISAPTVSSGETAVRLGQPMRQRRLRLVDTPR